MARTDNFTKFVKKPKSGAVKEKFKQEKKKEKKERSEAIEKHYAKKREERMLQNQTPSSSYNKPSTANKYAKGKPAGGEGYQPANGGEKNVRPNKFDKNKGERPASGERLYNDAKPDRKNKFEKGKPGQPGKGNFSMDSQKPARFNKDDQNKPGKASAEKSSYTAYRENRDEKPNKFHKDRPAKPANRSARSNKPTKFDDDRSEKQPVEKNAKSARKPQAVNRKDKGKPARAYAEKSANPEFKTGPKNRPSKEGNSTFEPREKKSLTEGKDRSAGTFETMPLNKYIAHSGVCARREAAVLVKDGKVKVNGEVATDPGTKVSTGDIIEVGGKKITPSKNFVYILLNKPKDYITTSDDPSGRRTVLDLVRHATDERIYPVGRLDRNTSGVLLFTNDGDLAQKLSHPSHEVKKVYEVKLDRVVTKADIEKIAAGVTLEDGFVAPDAIAYADPKDKSIIGIEIHSGRNRIVRRIFEHLKYDVKGLDRVMFAGLTKKDVQRGKWRFLKDKEIRILKFMNKSFLKMKDAED